MQHKESLMYVVMGVSATVFNWGDIFFTGYIFANGISECGFLCNDAYICVCNQQNIRI